MNDRLNQNHPRSWLQLSLMLVLFVGSGCSALVYEIVWFQMLQLVIGSSAISLGVLLATFMGGMCLGSLVFPFVVDRRRHPLRVYALLEILIGVCAVILLLVLPKFSVLYLTYLGSGTNALILRTIVCGIALLPPTVLMGATLPAIARWMETTPSGVAKMGLFYAANIAGAVFGCLLAGFYLLRLYDLQVATVVGFAINATVSLLALGIATWAPYQLDEAESASATEPRPAVRGNWSVYLVIALSGFSALGAEVVWTRIQTLLLGATVYTFSIILAVFLIGLGLGSSFGSWLAGRLRCPRMALGYCQLLVVFAIAWTGFMLTQALPYWPIDISLAPSAWTLFQLDFFRSGLAVLPAACLWGASFPLALAAAARVGQDPSRLVGQVYAANTLGAIGGAMFFSVMGIPQLGTQQAQWLLMVTAAVGALIMLVTRSAVRDQSTDAPGVTPLAPWLAVMLVTLVAAACVWSVAAVPQALIGYGRYFPTYLPSNSETPNFIYSGEGLNASIAVSEYNNGVRNFHVSGKVVASSEPFDMKLQRMLGHIPAMLHPNPKSVLVVGCGAGVTAGTFVLYPSVERIVICEIEPLIPRAADEYFGEENHHVIQDPRVEIVYDDARHFIAATDEKFDIITSDPIHPWVKGAASLYSAEYFELCQRCLNPDGIVTQWIPLYESNEEAVKSQITTFIRAFPHATVWGNTTSGGGYDLVMLGQHGETTIDMPRLDRQFEDTRYARVVASMKEARLSSPLDMMATYGGQGRDLQDWVDDRYLNRDVNFRLQYLAGMGHNLYQETLIYRRMLSHMKFPENLLQSASEEFKDRLARKLRIERDSNEP